MALIEDKDINYFPPEPLEKGLTVNEETTELQVSSKLLKVLKLNIGGALLFYHIISWNAYVTQSLKIMNKRKHSASIAYNVIRSWIQQVSDKGVTFII